MTVYVRKFQREYPEFLNVRKLEVRNLESPKSSQNQINLVSIQYKRCQIYIIIYTISIIQL